MRKKKQIDFTKINDKVLIFDIEMSKGLYFAFPSHRPQTLRVGDRHQGQFMISAAWRWLGDDTIHSVAVTDDRKRFKKDPTDHTHVVKTLYDKVSEADFVVGHNSDAFDLKHLQFMAYQLGMKPMPPRKSIDTLKCARRVFKHDSLSLDEIAHSRGLITKVDVPGKGKVWNAATLGCPKAIETIRHYNEGDIKVQTDVFLDMLPWMTNIPYLYNLEGKDGTGLVCPKCGEEHYIEKRGFLYNTTKTAKYQRFFCQTCGSWGQDKTINMLSKKYLDAVELLG